jgi:hypothetical protein
MAVIGGNMPKRLLTLVLGFSVALAFAPMTSVANADSSPGGWTMLGGPREAASMAYDSIRHRIVMFGGDRVDPGAYTSYGDTLEWDGTSWSSKAITGPVRRSRAAMAFDAARNRIVLFGGGFRGDTWEWDGANWAQKASRGPTPREGFSGGTPKRSSPIRACVPSPHGHDREPN